MYILITFFFIVIIKDILFLVKFDNNGIAKSGKDQ